MARLPADEKGRGKTVFVSFVLACEKAEASLVDEKPGFARARVDAIVEASRLASCSRSHRSRPECNLADLVKH